jgi:hypothetical protein
MKSRYTTVLFLSLRCTKIVFIMNTTPDKIELTPESGGPPLIDQTERKRCAVSALCRVNAFSLCLAPTLSAYNLSIPHIKRRQQTCLKLLRLESMWGRSTECAIKGGPKTFFGHFELELCQTQWNVAVLIESCRWTIFLNCWQFQDKT